MRMCIWFLDFQSENLIRNKIVCFNPLLEGIKFIGVFYWVVWDWAVCIPGLFYTSEFTDYERDY